MSNFSYDCDEVFTRELFDTYFVLSYRNFVTTYIVAPQGIVRSLKYIHQTNNEVVRIPDVSRVYMGIFSLASSSGLNTFIIIIFFLFSTYMALCGVTESYVVLCGAISTYVVLCKAVSTYMILGGATSTYAVLCGATSRYVVLCEAT